MKRMNYLVLNMTSRNETKLDVVISRFFENFFLHSSFTESNRVSLRVVNGHLATLKRMLWVCHFANLLIHNV
jgi:hypothetical protein